jgi:hypothetical protein
MFVLLFLLLLLCRHHLLVTTAPGFFSFNWHAAGPEPVGLTNKTKTTNESRARRKPAECYHATTLS